MDITKYKDALITSLEEEKLRLLKYIVNAEADERTLMSEVREKKLSMEANVNMTKLAQEKKMAERKISFLEEVRNEIENDLLIINP